MLLELFRSPRLYLSSLGYQLKTFWITDENDLVVPSNTIPLTPWPKRLSERQNGISSTAHIPPPHRLLYPINPLRSHSSLLLIQPCTHSLQSRDTGPLLNRLRSRGLHILPLLHIRIPDLGTSDDPNTEVPELDLPTPHPVSGGSSGGSSSSSHNGLSG